MQSKLAHEPDGLIFQPAGKDQAYKGGRDDEVAKSCPEKLNANAHLFLLRS